MKIIRRILLVVCLAVFLYSAGNLANIGYKYHKVNSDNKKLQEEVVTEVKQDSPLDRKVDFNQLKSINEDIVGWIYIPNTNIDYALLKGKTNDTYIHTNYEKKYSFAGSIFLYSIYSTKIIDATSDYYLKDIDYASYVANAKSSAKQSRDVDTQNTAPLLLLSTCYAHDTPTRSVLFARLEKNVK